MTTFNSDLTARQYRLLDYINANPAGVTKYQIVEDLYLNYPRYREQCKEENSHAYRNIRADFRAIQNSQIVHGVYGNIGGRYKRLTIVEYNNYMRSLWQSIIKKIKKVKNMEDHARHEGQYRLTFDYEKYIIDCFDKEKIEEQDVSGHD